MTMKAIQFAREVRAEARKVAWPNFKDTRSLTLVVFVLVVAISLFLTLADAIFSSSVRWIIGY